MRRYPWERKQIKGWNRSTVTLVSWFGYLHTERYAKKEGFRYLTTLISQGFVGHPYGHLDFCWSLSLLPSCLYSQLCVISSQIRAPQGSLRWKNQSTSPTLGNLTKNGYFPLCCTLSTLSSSLQLMILCYSPVDPGVPQEGRLDSDAPLCPTLGSKMLYTN